MTEEYVCVRTYTAFTVGRVYKTDKNGHLVDDDGYARTRIYYKRSPWTDIFHPYLPVEANE